MKIIVFYNSDKHGTLEVLDKLKTVLKTKKTDFEFIPSGAIPGVKADFAVSLGGDGTMLKVSQALAGRDIPLLGINLGNLGFLAEVDPQELENAIDHILAGNINISKRMLLEASVMEGDSTGRQIAKFLAFNDCVVKSGEESRVISISAFVDSVPLSSYVGDGIIVSTPTGSTAYALAAGGPIVYPELDLFVVCPICPHTLTQRPIILPENSKIELRIDEKFRKRKIIMSLDGQQDIILGHGDKILINKSAETISLATLPERSYFEILRRKFNWGVARENGKSKI